MVYVTTKLKIHGDYAVTAINESFISKKPSAKCTGNCVNEFVLQLSPKICATSRRTEKDYLSDGSYS